MNKKIYHSHDKIVKDTFSRPEVAKAYFKEFLPVNLKKVLDIESLVLIDGSYITQELNEYYSDLLFQFKEVASNKELIISLIFEHKSYPDHLTLVQVGNYIFNQWIREIKSNIPLKPIIPLIYYQGKNKWSPPKLIEFFNGYTDSIMHYIPNYNFLFFSVSTLSEEQWEDITINMLAIALAGHNPRVDIEEYLNKLSSITSLKSLNKIESNFAVKIFVYELSNTQVQKCQIIKMLKTIPSPIKEDFVSTYDEIKHEGNIEGKIEGKTEVIISGFKYGISVSMLSIITGISKSEIKSILRKY